MRSTISDRTLARVWSIAIARLARHGRSRADASWCAVVVALASLAMAPVASAECRTAHPEEASPRDPPAGSRVGGRGIPRFVRIADDMVLGADCGDQGPCLFVGDQLCWLGLAPADEVEASWIERAGGAPLLVLRWDGDQGGTTYFVGAGVQVWSREPELRLVSVLSAWQEGVNEQEGLTDDGPEEWCALERSVSVESTRLRVGPRRAGRDCGNTIAHYDRVGTTELGAAARTWRWDRLAQAR